MSRPAPAASQSTQRDPDSQTLPSQTTQKDQTDRVTSPHSQTGPTTKVTSEGEKSDIQSTKDIVETLVETSRQTPTKVTSEGEKSDIQSTKDIDETLVETSRQTQIDSENNEMSEVIRPQNDRVVINRRLQNAQNWCTEPSEAEFTENDSLETDSIPMTNAKITLHDNDSVKGKGYSAVDSSQKSTENGVNESENSVVNGHSNHAETPFDSEEMSEVIPFQDAGKIPLAPKLGTQNTESMDEMSEVIEQQDFHRSLEHNNKENMASVVNGVAEVNETGDLKSKDLASVGSKGKVLNGLDSNVGVSGENKETLINGDELNEEELMDTLDS